MDTACLGRDLMNDSSCPSPPRTATVTAAQAVAGTVVTINQSLTIRKVNVHGCIFSPGTANNTAVNITNIGLKMVPWSLPSGSFIPPRSADDGTINITNPLQFNLTYGQGCLAYYNISLLNQSSYLVEIYAKNASYGNDAGNPGTANNLA